MNRQNYRESNQGNYNQRQNPPQSQQRYGGSQRNQRNDYSNQRNRQQNDQMYTHGDQDFFDQDSGQYNDFDSRQQSMNRPYSDFQSEQYRDRNQMFEDEQDGQQSTRQGSGRSYGQTGMQSGSARQSPDGSNSYGRKYARSGSQFNQSQQGFESGEYPENFGTSQRYGGNESSFENPRLRGQHAGKGPKGFKRSDERLLEEVSRALERDDDIDASEIEVVCKDGMITLTGEVESRQMKRDAEFCAEQVEGVKDVMNHLKISSGSKNDSRQQESTSRSK